jgi:hypothetical protein
VEEALHKGLDALGVTCHQELVQSLHGDDYVPAWVKRMLIIFSICIKYKMVQVAE